MGPHTNRRIVLQGMELLTWLYDDATWAAHKDSERFAATPVEPDGDRLFDRFLGGWTAALPRDPPRVVFTSTGMLVGDTPWLWRWIYWLPPPRIVRATGPDVLEITFSRPWRLRRKVRLPVPLNDARSAEGLVKHLRQRSGGPDIDAGFQ